MDSDTGQLTARVGERVRAARKSRKLSRRELSERSGVSARYLAQLEGGGGNISIGLLQRVARALGETVEALVREADEPARVARLFQAASAETKKEIRRLLDPAAQQDSRAGRVCLIGLRGAGKSTLGQHLADTLALPFLEMNRRIEEHAGIPAREVFSLYGDDGYRQLESEVIDGIVASMEHVVLAASGGVVANSETFEKVLAHFHTIWIKAAPLDHMERVRAQGDLRPMEGNPRALLQLRQLLKTREPDYQRTGFQLDTTGKDLSTSKDELVALARATAKWASSPIEAQRRLGGRADHGAQS